jgi:copper chaperone
MDIQNIHTMFHWFKKSTSDLQVSTNINCASCVAKVKPYLDEDQRINTWKVNTEDPKKMLSVQGSISRDELNALITKAGYRIKE